jgi:hypothetical protein
MHGSTVPKTRLSQNRESFPDPVPDISWTPGNCWQPEMSFRCVSVR